MPFTFKLSQRLARMRPQGFFAPAVALAIAAAFACEMPSTPPEPGTSTASRLAVSPKVLTLQQNQAVDLMAVGFTSVGDTADLAVTWSVTSGLITDTSTNNGRHYGRYRAGSDTGKVKVVAQGNPGGIADTAVVTVTLTSVASVTVSPASASILVGQTVQLAATLLDANGNPLSGRTVTWTTSNGAVATVSSSGLVTAVALGVATVTASSEGQSGTSDITLANVPVASVTVSPASASILVGQTVQLAATLLDANGNPLSGRTVTWTTSNGAVATVSSSGLVTAVALGVATVTASSEGQSGTSDITVANVPVASVTVSPASASLLVGATGQLSAVTKDAAGNTLSGRPVTWSSSAAAIAAVSSTGLATGLAAGAATITATSEGQSGSAALTIYAGGTHIGSPDLEPGLLGRTDLVLFEDFEYADWETHWSKISHSQNYTAVTTPLFQGNRGLEVRAPSGSHNGTSWDFTFAAEGLAEPDAIYLRYYVRFNDSWQKSGDGEIGKLPGFGGTYNRCGWGGSPGDGTCWSARMMNFDTDATNQVGFYVYHIDQGGSYGQHMRWSPLLERHRWYCVEAYVQLNSLSGGTANYDGVLRGWIDGAVAFERTNLRFRNVSSTHIEKIWWDIYIGGSWTADRNMAIHFDNIVVAKQRIGCYSSP